jgi:MFS family permease
VRPLGALVFGRIGDLVGRKYTFLITIVVMGLSTALVGVLPTYAQIGIWAPSAGDACASRRASRSAAEYGGAGDLRRRARAGRASAAITRAGSRPRDARFFPLARRHPRLPLGFGEDAFKAWGWRMPFLISGRCSCGLGLHPAAPAGIAALRRDEVERPPVARAADGKLRENGAMPGSCCLPSSARPPDRVSSGTRASSMRSSFLQNTLKLDFQTAYLLIAVALVIGTPFFVFFGRLSDRIGRKRIMVTGCLLARAHFHPDLQGAHAVG